MSLSKYLVYVLFPTLTLNDLYGSRLRAAGKANADGVKRSRQRDRAAVRAFPAPEANAELQANLDVCQIICFFQQKILLAFVFVYLS
jgi:hypothetical protein